MRLKMEHDKKHFCHLFTALMKKTAEDHESSQKFILSLFHQLKHVNTSFDNSKVILI